MTCYFNLLYNYTASPSSSCRCDSQRATLDRKEGLKKNQVPEQEDLENYFPQKAVELELLHDIAYVSQIIIKFQT